MKPVVTGLHSDAVRLAARMLGLTPLVMLDALVDHTELRQADIARQIGVSASVLSTIRSGREPRYCTGKALERLYLEHYDAIRAGEARKALEENGAKCHFCGQRVEVLLGGVLKRHRRPGSGKGGGMTLMDVCRGSGRKPKTPEN